MKINDALLAAKASLNEVTDLETLTKIREPFTTYRNEHPFVEFVDEPFGEVFPFRSDSAHVVTFIPRIERKDLSSHSDEAHLGKPGTKLRHIRRGSGRNDVTVKPVPIEVRAAAPSFMLFDDAGEPLFGTDQQLISFLSQSTKARIEAHLLQALAASAREQNRITICTHGDLREAVRSATDELGKRCTVLAHHALLTKLLDSPRFTYELGEFGHVVPSSALGENNAVVVANEPKAVGFVRVVHEPVVYCRPNEFSEIECVAMTRCGFCAWGDAPVRWFDCSSAV